VFFQIAAPWKRLVAVLARVWVGVVDVGNGGSGGCRGRDVRRRSVVVTMLLLLLLLVVVVVVVVMVVVLVDRGTGPAVVGGAAVWRRVVLRHGRAPRRSGLFRAHLTRAAQRF